MFVQNIAETWSKLHESTNPEKGHHHQTLGLKNTGSTGTQEQLKEEKDAGDK